MTKIDWMPSRDISDLRSIVWTAISEATDGVTLDAIEDALRVSHRVTLACVRELARRGLVFDTLRRRTTRNGREAIVWESR